MTGINRRQFSLLLGCGLFAPQLLASQQVPQQQRWFSSAAQTTAGAFELIIVGSEGQTLLKHPLPARAHHVELHPFKPLLAAVGRRPEQFIDLVNLKSGHLEKRVTAEAGYHFYGHAIFSADGRYLISTENKISTGKGQIVFRDVEDNYQVVRQYSSAGIGPHELKMMPDGETLVVANGGILTHPKRGREKLNLNTMQPSLAYIDSSTGILKEQVFLPEEMHQLSIRHIDINPQGRVVIALQYQGEKYDDVPLVAFHSLGKEIELVRAPGQINNAMKQYCGSARFDRSGQIAAISSPRGDLVTFWNQHGEFLTSTRATDGCGLAAMEEDGNFLISTGRGPCYRYNAFTAEKTKLPLTGLGRVNWDNHLTSLS